MSFAPHAARYGSDQLFEGDMSESTEDRVPRSWYLENALLDVEPYWLSVSSFINPKMASHLMRKKKPTALGRKWEDGCNDKITNMEGALHTFVSPIVDTVIHGDYIYRPLRGHDIDLFPEQPGDNYPRVRRVLISGLVHLDFETRDVLWKLIRAEGLEDLSKLREENEQHIEILDVKSKQNDKQRAAYDRALRTQTCLALLQGENISEFVSSSTDPECVIDMGAASSALADAISSSDIHAVLDTIRNKWLCTATATRTARRQRVPDILSLHLLFLCMLHQVRNEHAALDRICRERSKGVDDNRNYVYTYDPPQIFRVQLGDEGKQLLMFLHAAALRYLTFSMPDMFKTLKVFGYNDFGNPIAIETFKNALRDVGARAGTDEILVVPKAALFQGEEGNLYKPPVQGRGCYLVLHNNSDGFGNNVEFELGSGSLDAVIGAWSGMAVCLHRHEMALETRERYFSWGRETISLEGHVSEASVGREGE